MKKIESIFLVIIFAAAANAQIVNKDSISGLDKDQLNVELAKSLKSIKTGKILTGTGVATSIIGAVCIGYGISESNNSTEIGGGLPRPISAYGGLILFGGLTTAGIGIYKWTRGQKRKTEIEMDLVNIQLSGSAPINGIRLRVMF